MYDLFIAPRPELDLELEWGYNRRAKKKDLSAKRASLPPQSRRCFLDALVHWERKFLDRYIAVKGNLRVYALQQDPDSNYGSASSLTTLQCVIKASHLMWVDKLRRWMTGRELLLAQGFPVYGSVLREMQPWLVDHEYPVAVCSFNRSRASLKLPPRSRKQFGSMAGNAMCVPVVAAYLTFIFMHVVQDDAACVRVPAPLTPALSSPPAKQSTAADAFLIRFACVRRSGVGLAPLAPVRCDLPAFPFCQLDQHVQRRLAALPLRCLVLLL